MDRLIERIENIDYTHLLGYQSEVVAVEVMTLVKEVVSDHMDKVVEQLEEQKEIHEKLGFEVSKLCVFERFEARPTVFDEKMCHEKAVEVLGDAIEIVFDLGDLIVLCHRVKKHVEFHRLK